MATSMTKPSARPDLIRRIALSIMAIAGLAVLATLVWQGITANGVPNPALRHLDHNAVVVDTAILVLREGLEAILVISAITASFKGDNTWYRKPVALGAGVALFASVLTWFVAIAILNAVSAPALAIQAATGLLAVVVLLIIMNWFFHKIYWTGWISKHNQERRRLMALGPEGHRRVALGLGLLGFTAMYREGFEVVLFLQTLRLQVGSWIVLQGVLLGLAFTAVVGALTFVANQHLPYKKMLIATGIMLGFVLVVMVGESAQELQQAGWLMVTPIHIAIPDWMGLWFALFPNVQGIVAQVLAGAFVVGSYVIARDMRAKRPFRHVESTSTGTIGQRQAV